MTTATQVLDIEKDTLLFSPQTYEDSADNFDLTLWREVLEKPWPTMYDLPSENPEEPGLPDQFHDLQAHLLTESYRPSDYPANQVFAAADLNLYYDLAHPQWYKRPDWYGVVGVPSLYHSKEMRDSYVVWDEGVSPFVVAEFLSPSSADEDLGKTTAEENAPPTKWQVYEQILKIPYYVIFDKHTNKLQGFKLTGGKYRQMELKDGRLWLPELKIGLGLWQGIYQGVEQQWLRWCDADGVWIPTPFEQERQAKEQERFAKEQALYRAQQAEYRTQQERQAKEQALYRAQQAEYRVQQERLAKEQEQQAKEQALYRAQQEQQAKEQALYHAQQERLAKERLANKLRELGIDPTTI